MLSTQSPAPTKPPSACLPCSDTITSQSTCSSPCGSTTTVESGVDAFLPKLLGQMGKNFKSGLQNCGAESVSHDSRDFPNKSKYKEHQGENCQRESKAGSLRCRLHGRLPRCKSIPANPARLMLLHRSQQACDFYVPNLKAIAKTTSDSTLSSGSNAISTPELSQKWDAKGLAALSWTLSWIARNFQGNLDPSTRKSSMTRTCIAQAVRTKLLFRKVPTHKEDTPASNTLRRANRSVIQEQSKRFVGLLPFITDRTDVSIHKAMASIDIQDEQYKEVLSGILITDGDIDLITELIETAFRAKSSRDVSRNQSLPSRPCPGPSSVLQLSGTARAEPRSTSDNKDTEIKGKPSDVSQNPSSFLTSSPAYDMWPSNESLEKPKSAAPAERLPESGADMYRDHGAVGNQIFDWSWDKSDLNRSLIPAASTAGSPLPYPTITALPDVESFPPLPPRTTTADWISPLPDISKLPAQDVASSSVPRNQCSILQVDTPTTLPNLTLGAGTVDLFTAEASPELKLDVRRKSVILPHPEANPRIGDILKPGSSIGSSSGARRSSLRTSHTQIGHDKEDHAERSKLEKKAWKDFGWSTAKSQSPEEMRSQESEGPAPDGNTVVKDRVKLGKGLSDRTRLLVERSPLRSEEDHAGIYGTLTGTVKDGNSCESRCKKHDCGTLLTDSRNVSVDWIG